MHACVFVCMPACTQNTRVYAHINAHACARVHALQTGAVYGACCLVNTLLERRDQGRYRALLQQQQQQQQQLQRPSSSSGGNNSSLCSMLGDKVQGTHTLGYTNEPMKPCLQQCTDPNQFQVGGLAAILRCLLKAVLPAGGRHCICCCCVSVPCSMTQHAQPLPKLSQAPHSSPGMCYTLQLKCKALLQASEAGGSKKSRGCRWPPAWLLGLPP